MINVLPPQLQTQIGFAKRNRKLMRYLELIVIVFLLLGSLLLVSSWYADRQIRQLRSTLDDQKRQTESLKSIEANTRLLQTDAVLVGKLLKDRTVFSKVLEDLAAAIPANSYLINIGLSGDNSKPVQVVVVTDSYEDAAILRNSLLQSPRIEAVDIQSINANSQTGGVTVNLVVAFKKGANG